MQWRLRRSSTDRWAGEPSASEQPSHSTVSPLTSVSRDSQNRLYTVTLNVVLLKNIVLHLGASDMFGCRCYEKPLVSWGTFLCGF